MAEVPVSVTASLPRPVTPAESNAVFAAAAVPVNVVTVAALTAPDVLPSNVLRTAAASVVSVSVTASLPRPVIVPAVFCA